MGLAILAPVVVFSTLSLNMLLESERVAALRGMHETARATALVIDRELLGAEAALKVLAASPSFSAGDLQALYVQAKAADRGPGAWTIVLDSNGQQVLNTIVPYGTRLPPPVAKRRVDQVLATGRTLVSDLIPGPVMHTLVSTLNVPVPASGDRRYVLAATFKADFFEQLLQQQQIPASWIVGIIDTQGHFVARSHRDAELAGRPARAELVDAARKTAVGQIRHTTLEGVDSYDVFTHSAISGWTVAVAAPVSTIEASAKKAVLVAFLGFVFAVVCAAFVAALFGRHFYRAINQASRAAASLGKGEALLHSRSSVKEFQELQDALGQAAQVLSTERHARREAEIERERLLASEMIARRHAEAENEAKDQFLAMLGHEIRNPLSAIHTAAALIGMEVSGNRNLSRAREILERQSHNLSKIVDDLLDVTRVSMGKVNLRPERLDLAEVAAACVEGLRATGRMRDWAMTLDVHPAWVDADRTRLEQVINNLLINATKYTPVGGMIDLSVAAADNEAVLTIRDSGIGMSADLLPKIFDLFVQAPATLDRTSGGLGIGLTLVRQLVTLHGGTVSARSDGPGKGSTFIVRLPRLEAPAVAANSAPDAHQHKRHRILLIEDNADGREMIAMALSTYGHDILEADNGADGIALADQKTPDVALIDIGLPGISGYDVARRLRANPDHRGMRLIALTGYGQDADRRQALDAGFDEHLVKPVDIPQLLRCVDGNILAS